MSRCYLDANFLYVHLRNPDNGSDSIADRWRERVMEEIADGGAVISALVLDEIAYRLILAWLRDDGSPDPLTTFRKDDGTVMRSMASRLHATWDAIDDPRYGGRANRSKDRCSGESADGGARARAAGRLLRRPRHARRLFGDRQHRRGVRSGIRDPPR